MSQLKNIEGGCWRGYERVPGTIEFSKGSCRKIGSARKSRRRSKSPRRRRKSRRKSPRLSAGNSSKHARNSFDFGSRMGPEYFYAAARTVVHNGRKKKLSPTMAKRSRELARSARKRVAQRSRSRLRKLIDLAKFEHIDWYGKSQTPAEVRRIKFRNSIRIEFYFFIMTVLYQKFMFIYKYGLATPDYVTKFSTLKRTTLILLQEASKGGKTMTLEVFRKTLERLSRLTDRFSNLRFSNNSKVKSAIKTMKNVIESSLDKTNVALRSRYLKNWDTNQFQSSPEYDFPSSWVLAKKERLATQALGVARNAQLSEIKKAYRKLSKIYHPDKKGGDNRAQVTLTNAYEFLTRIRNKSKSN